MMPDRLQYCLEHFWNDQQCDQIWILGPRIYDKFISTTARTLWEHLWNISFSYLRIWNYEIVWRSVNLLFRFMFRWKLLCLDFVFWKFGICKFEICNMRFTIRNLTLWKCEIPFLKCWHFEVVGVWKFELLKFWKVKISKNTHGNDEDPRKTNLQNLGYEFHIY